MRASDLSFTTLGPLTSIAISLVLMAVKVSHYRAPLATPGGKGYVFGTASLLFVYAFLVVWATRGDGPWRRSAVLLATPLGVIAGMIQMAHLAQEEFMDLGRIGNGISAFGLLLCTFVLWGIAGYRAAHSTDSLRSSAMAGLWSATVTMSMLILLGFILEFYLAPPSPEYVATWGEFKRSGWTDIHAFTIANTLDSAQSHLIVGPIAGVICGGIGGVVSRLRGKQQQKLSTNRGQQER